MHVYITGIAGFLGANLADYYIKKGFKVSGNDNLIGGDLQNIDTNKVNFMDNENHKDTWNNFTKFVLWGTVAVILVLVLMAIFLL